MLSDAVLFDFRKEAADGFREESRYPWREITSAQVRHQAAGLDEAGCAIGLMQSSGKATPGTVKSGSKKAITYRSFDSARRGLWLPCEARRHERLVVSECEYLALCGSHGKEASPVQRSGNESVHPSERGPERLTIV